MTIRDALLPVEWKLRAMDHEVFGERPYTVYVRRSSGNGGLGSVVTNVDWQLPERPRVRRAGARDVAEAIGLVQIGQWVLDQITPSFPGGGVTPAQIDPEPSGDEKVFLVLDGPSCEPYNAAAQTGGSEFTISGRDWTRPYEYRLFLTPRTGSPS